MSRRGWLSPVFVIGIALVLLLWWATDSGQRRSDVSAPSEKPSSAIFTKEESPSTGVDSSTDLTPDHLGPRTELESSPLRGRVLSEEGQPITGAQVSWTALEVIDLEWEPAWQGDDWGHLPRRIEWSSSDEKGHFVFSDSPCAQDEHSVLWATHPAFQAACFLLGKDSISDPDCIIRLKSSPPILVRVEDAEGNPVAAAEVFQFGLTPPFAAPDGDQGLNEERARRQLWRKFETDESGTCRIGPFQGEQILVAINGKKRSIPWRGLSRSQVVLRLADGFTVGGRVFLPDWTHLNYVGERRISIVAQRGNVRYPLATLRSVQDGPWGPIDLPILEGAHYRIHLEGSPIIPAIVDFSASDPGSHLSFDLQAELGHNIWIRALDEHENIILDAEAIVNWTNEGKTNFVRRRARADGYINPWSMPSGSVEFTVSAPGYVPFKSDSIFLPLKEEGTYEVVLTRAGRLHGMCLQGGKPVENFEVVLWRPGTPAYKQIHSFFGKEDGSFEVATAPIGELLVTASSDSFVGSEPRPVLVSADSVAKVTLELTTPMTGVGKVLDYMTREPIPTAEVEVQIMGDLLSITPWGGPIQVQSDGRFRIEGFVSGANEVRVRAPGYSEARATAFATPGQEIDFGEIALSPPRTLELQLTAAGTSESVDFTAYTAESIDEPELLPTSFSSEGIARFENVPAGSRVVIIDSPLGPYSRLYLRLDVEKEWKFTHRVAGPRYLTVKVVAEDGARLEQASGMWIMYECPNGVAIHVGAGVPEDGIVRVEGLDTESVTVDVLDGNWETIAAAQGSFAGAEELQLVVPIGGEPHVFRVIDDEAEPIAGAALFVQDPLSPGSWLTGTTNSVGECRLFGVPSRDVIVHVLHNSRGTRHGIQCDGETDLTEIVIHADAQLQLALLDDDHPLGGVSCRFVSETGMSLSTILTSDSSGLVSWEGLHPGRFRISLFHKDCWPIVFEAEAQKEATTTPVQVRRLGNLSFVLRSSSGLPVFGQEIQLHSIEFDTDVSDWIVEGRVRCEDGLASDQRGEIHVKGLPRGRYRWTLTASTGDFVQSEVEVPSLETEEVVITLP